jgi:hypothetical protein
VKAYTLQPTTARPAQAIKDALNLAAETSHVRWLIGALNHNQVVYQMRGIGYPDMSTTQTGIFLAKGLDVDALAAAGLFDQQKVLVTLHGAIGTKPVAVIQRGGGPRRIGVLEYNLGQCRYVPSKGTAERDWAHLET